ncbi:hypothetical protein [Enterococcus sp. AZ136]
MLKLFKKLAVKKAMAKENKALADQRNAAINQLKSLQGQLRGN